MTPVPEGIISTSTGPVDPTSELDAAAVEAYEGMAEVSAELNEAIAAADAEEATYEFLLEEENDQA